MAGLAIRGHATRGSEVINLLEMLGANRLGYNDTFVGFYYYIECGAIQASDEYPTYSTFFTLEEFLEKYPYKVGDKVMFKHINIYVTDTIKSMEWYANGVVYTLKEYEEELMVEDLQPFKEETIEDKGTLVQIDLTKELRIADEVEVILGDYEFVLKDSKTYFVKKKPQYPKTYKECCNILGIEDRENGYCGYEYELLGEFQKLYICRNAYWKIAGEELGLDKPWEPDWKDNSDKYFICYLADELWKSNIRECNRFLVFPTEEIRDAFYENFKELIEQCKELL